MKTKEMGFDEAVRKAEYLLTYGNTVSTDLTDSIIDTLSKEASELKRLKKELADAIEKSELNEDIFTSESQRAESFYRDNHRMYNLLRDLKDKYDLSELNNLNDNFENDYHKEEDPDLFLTED